MIRRWGSLSAVAALVMMSLCVMGASLACRHPITSAHHPRIAMHTLITQSTNTAIHCRLLLMRRSKSIHAHINAFLGGRVDVIFAGNVVLLVSATALMAEQSEAVLTRSVLLLIHAEGSLLGILLLLLLEVFFVGGGRCDPLHCAATCRVAMIVPDYLLVIVVLSHHLRVMRAIVSPF